MGPDFHNYSYHQLLQSFRNLNRNKFPERLDIILSEIEKKKPSDIEIIKVDSGYRFLKKDQIPKPQGKEHIQKVFSFETCSNSYFKNFLKTSWIIIPAGIAAFYKTAIRNENLGINYVYAGVTIFLFGFVYLYFNYRSKGGKVEFIFDDLHITEKRGKSKNIYSLSELRNIYSNDSKNNDNPIDLIELTFENNRKLKFSSFEPQFNEIRAYLKVYLSNRMNFEYYLDGNSII